MSSPGLESGSVYTTYEVKKEPKETKNIDTNLQQTFYLNY